MTPKELWDWNTMYAINNDCSKCQTATKLYKHKRCSKKRMPWLWNGAQEGYPHNGRKQGSKPSPTFGVSAKGWIQWRLWQFLVKVIKHAFELLEICPTLLKFYPWLHGPSSSFCKNFIKDKNLLEFMNTTTIINGSVLGCHKNM